jgi:hypothetical protein
LRELYCREGGNTNWKFPKRDIAAERVLVGEDL